MTEDILPPMSKFLLLIQMITVERLLLHVMHILLYWESDSDGVTVIWLMWLILEEWLTDYYCCMDDHNDESDVRGLGLDGSDERYCCPHFAPLVRGLGLDRSDKRYCCPHYAPLLSYIIWLIWLPLWLWLLLCLRYDREDKDCWYGAYNMMIQQWKRDIDIDEQMIDLEGIDTTL